MLQRRSPADVAAQLDSVHHRLPGHRRDRDLVRAYAKQHQPVYRIDVPTVVQQFPGELLLAPRSVAERLFTELRGWRTEAAGGHFAAWERPEDFAAGVRETAQLI